MTQDSNSYDIVIVGGGPVGLWEATQLKKRDPSLRVKVYERHTEYQRSHVLRLENFSMQIYGKNAWDKPEREFYKSVTGKSLRKIFLAATTGHTFIRTDDLENALKKYAGDLGVDVDYSKVDSPEAVMAKHPDTKTFIAADGAHSKMRAAILGEDAVKTWPLQHVVEIKYQAQGRAGQLKAWDVHRVNTKMNSLGFEYVGRTKDGVTPVTLRFFTDKVTYDAIPEAGFKNPLSIDDPRLPPKLAADIDTYMKARKSKAGETYKPGSGKLSTLTLLLYRAKTFAEERDGRSWFFVGDAALGVPYFRSLNAGMIMGSQLAGILTNDILSDKAKRNAFNAVRPLNAAWEFTAARGKDMVLNSYDGMRKAAGWISGNAPDNDNGNDTDGKPARRRNAPGPRK